jgi:hypothetical protein
MEPLFVTTTRLTFEKYRRFNYTVQRKFCFWCIVICSLLEVLAGGDVPLYIRVIELFVFAVINSCLVIVIMYIMARLGYYSDKTLRDEENGYSFYEDYLINVDNISQAKVDYDKLDRIIETSKDFYLMLSKTRGYILPKEDCSDGLISFLHDLKERIGK